MGCGAPFLLGAQCPRRVRGRRGINRTTEARGRVGTLRGAVWRRAAPWGRVCGRRGVLACSRARARAPSCARVAPCACGEATGRRGGACARLGRVGGAVLARVSSRSSRHMSDSGWLPVLSLRTCVAGYRARSGTPSRRRRVGRRPSTATARAGAGARAGASGAPKPLNGGSPKFPKRKKRAVPKFFSVLTRRICKSFGGNLP